MAVGIGGETPYSLKLEPITAEGAPRVRVTIYNIEGSQTIRLERTSEGETMVVQGASRLQLSGLGIVMDWAVPLNRKVIYSVLVDGEVQSTGTIQVDSKTSWVQDPLFPDTALPVYERTLHPGGLTMVDTLAASGTYISERSESAVMGSRYPTVSGSGRQAASGVDLSLYSPDEETSDKMFDIVSGTPILMFRPNRRLRPFPPVAYLSGDVTEVPLDQINEEGFTRWELEGNLVQAVMAAVRSGFITYGDVQNLLGGYTYGEVLEAAKSTIYLDWKKNPLIFMNL